MSDLIVIPTEGTTPNVIVSNPNIRRVVVAFLGALGIILGTVVVVDASAPAFDLAAYTNPIAQAYLYLSGIFGLAVTLPNIPRKVSAE
jgi:hypothetical protein